MPFYPRLVRFVIYFQIYLHYLKYSFYYCSVETARVSHTKNLSLLTKLAFVL